MNFQERFQVAQDCLPRAGYVRMLTELHDQMLRKIADLEHEIKVLKEKHCYTKEQA